MDNNVNIILNLNYKGPPIEEIVAVYTIDKDGNKKQWSQEAINKYIIRLPKKEEE